MQILLVFVLLGAVTVNGQISLLDAIAYNNSIGQALAQVANAPLDWLATLNSTSYIPDLVKLLCIRSGGSTFQEVPLNDQAVLEKFDFNATSHFFFHGWISNTSETWATTFKNNWIASGRLGNLCLVDWSLIAYGDYLTTAFTKQRLVALYMANTYLPWLKTKGLVYQDIILSGHSMGAQIIGYMGQLLLKQIKFIIGLDPAGPLFDAAPDFYRLSDDDADYVQVVHTCMGLYGYLGKCGDADFYINFGYSPQPQCNPISPEDLVAIHCSHARALDLFMGSLLFTSSSTSLCKGIKCDVAAIYELHLYSSIPPTIDTFGLDTLKLHGDFYTSTGTSATCTGALY